MKKILIQIDTDARSSVFDRVVAIDAGADEIFSYSAVKPEDVRDLVYGAIFTRGPADLQNTAIFVGGQDIRVGEEVLTEASKAFLGPLRISLMLDSSGANTTAASAVLAVDQHLPLDGAEVLVLGATGSVGRRVARLCAYLGASVRLGSRDQVRAQRACEQIDVTGKERKGSVVGVATGDSAALQKALDGVQAVVSAGGAGVTLLPVDARVGANALRVAVDLNAVPPAGILGIEVHDKAVDRDGILCYGAVGVGGRKMKIHRAAVASLFESNERILDAEEILDIGRKL